MLLLSVSTSQRCLLLTLVVVTVIASQNTDGVRLFSYRFVTFLLLFLYCLFSCCLLLSVDVVANQYVIPDIVDVVLGRWLSSLLYGFVYSLLVHYFFSFLAPLEIYYCRCCILVIQLLVSVLVGLLWRLLLALLDAVNVGVALAAVVVAVEWFLLFLPLLLLLVCFCILRIGFFIM
jgi:hypothetical protein